MAEEIVFVIFVIFEFVALSISPTPMKSIHIYTIQHTYIQYTYNIHNPHRDVVNVIKMINQSESEIADHPLPSVPRVGSVGKD